MASPLHEAPLALLREEPRLLLRLVRDAIGLDLGPDVVTRFVDSVLSEAVPVERRADAVITVEKDDETVAAFVVEVQLSIDPKKRFSWPHYLAAVHARYQCMSRLVVIAPHQDVATWAARPIETFQPTSVFTPLVFGPSEIPRVPINEALLNPELAVLSALVHGDEADVRTAYAATAPLEGEVRAYYNDLIAEVLGGTAEKILESIMRSEWTFKGPMFRKEAAKERAEGKLEGKIEGMREALGSILQARAFALSDEGKRRLDECDDPEQLLVWNLRALTATSESELFAS